MDINARQHITRKLEDAQRAPSVFGMAKKLYRLYTENVTTTDVPALVQRYFAGATITYGLGLDNRTQQTTEHSVTIEIVTSAPDGLQRALSLAQDLRVLHRQVSVLVTEQDVRTFEVTALSFAEGGESTPPSPVATLDRPSDSPRYVSASQAQRHRLDVVAGR